MKELQRRQYIRQILYSVPSLLVLGILATFLARGAFNLVMVERQSAERVKELEAEVKALDVREGELTASIEKLQTEDGIVEEIKEKFSAVREGEHVAIIVDERRKATTSEEEKKGWFGRFWDAIMRK